MHKPSPLRGQSSKIDVATPQGPSMSPSLPAGLGKGSLRFMTLITMVLTGLLGVVALGQTNTGTITGKILDPQNAAIQGATVTAVDIDTQVKRSTETNGDGAYSFAGLIPGQYEVSASSPGFQQVSSKVTLAVGQTAQLDLSSIIGSATQQITVTAAGATLATESHDLGTTLSGSEIEQLPAVSGRLFDTLRAASNTKPYDSNVSSGIAFFGDPSDSLTIGGLQPGSTTYLEDGANNVALVIKSANIQPSIEAVQEANVISNNASARYMEPSVVNVVTKNGTNVFHGRVYDYIRNDAFNTLPYYATTTTPLRYNLFGANLGGPILKKKLFFFFDFSALREHSSGLVGAVVPTAAERQGDFSASGEPTIYDPTTYNPNTGTISPFPGNRIPNISSFASAFLSYYPLPNGSRIPGQNFSKMVQNTSTFTTYLGRLDYTIGQSDQIFGAWETSNPHQTSPSFAPVNYFDSLKVQDATDAYIQETHGFNAALLNIARFAYNGGNVVETLAGVGVKDFSKQFHLQGLTPTPNQWAPPAVNPSGYSGLGFAFAPQGGKQQSFQFSEEIDITKGLHSIFMGVEMDKINLDGVWTIWSDGQYIFSGQYTSNHASGARYSNGSGLADLLLGYPTQSYGGTGVSSANFREYDVLGYVQDDWRVRPSLTLNLGLRYDYLGAPADPNGRSTVYDLPTNTYHKGTWHQNYLAFAPRFGFAKTLNPQTVIRGGYGIMHTSLIYGNLQWIVATPPNFTLQINTYDRNSPTPIETSLVANPTDSSLTPFTSTLKMPTPMVQEWNLNIQRSLGANWLATIGYVGNKSSHLEAQFNANQGAPVNPANPLPLSKRRPYQWIGDVSEISNVGYGNYNGLEADLQKRFSDGLSMLATYIYSKAMDVQTASGYNAQNGNDLAADYGVSDINRKHDFKLSAVYDLPLGPGTRFMNKGGWGGRALLGGWRFSGILNVRSGAPFTIYANDLTNTGGTHSTRATQLCNGDLGGEATRQRWFNTSCYQQPVGIFGNVARGALVGPRQTTTDTSLFKTVALGSESRRFELRADFLNAFNHPMLQIPIAQSITDSSFGQVTDISSGRTIQLSGKIVF